MVKTYYKFDPERTMGMMYSPYANIHYDSTGKYAITPALEKVIIWNMRTNKVVHTLQATGEAQNVTCITVSPDDTRIAVGYQEGKVVIFKKETISYSSFEELQYIQHQKTKPNEPWQGGREPKRNENKFEQITYERELESNGHGSSVTSLTFNNDCSLLASGGDDTEIVIWDVTASSGLYRMRGHKSRITGLVFLRESQALISSSKDMLIKIWELETQHCIQTLIGSRNEIWGIAKNPQETRLVAGSIDNEIRVWNLEPLLETEEDARWYDKDPIFMGAIQRRDEDRVLNISFDPSGGLLAVHGDSENLEIFRVRSKREQDQKLKNKQKRKDKKKEKSKKEDDEEMEEEEKELTLTAGIEFTPLVIVKSANKIRSFNFHPIEIYNQPTTDITEEEQNAFKILVGTLRNTIEEYSVTNEENIWKFKLEQAVERYGHGTPVRALAMSHDNHMTVSVSSEECRIWNVDSGSCLRAFNTGYGLSCLFVPGDKHVVIGTKKGHLELYDLASAELIQKEKSHKGPVWSMVLKPDRKGIITASSDRTVKFYDFELVQDDTGDSKLQLALEHTLQMNEDVISVSVSHKFLTVALLDSTVKVFYLDSLKFFLSLFGHKLPVNSMSISSDQTVIVTASADKNIKIWGLDFGDCHRSLFAHQQAIMGVQFIPGTHYFLSVAKDGCVKYWDADKYECIQIIRPEMNHSPLWCMSMTSFEIDYDDFDSGRNIVAPRVVVSGHERAIWSYIQTDSVLFLEEEKEKQMEKQYEKELAQSQQFKDLQNRDAEATHAGMRSIDTIRDGEKLMEMLDIAIEEEKRWQEYNEGKRLGLTVEQPGKNPLLLGNKPQDFTWRSLLKIRRSEIDLVLAIVPYNYAIYLLKTLVQLIKSGTQIEYAAKIALVLAQIHQTAIQMDVDVYNMINELSALLKQKLEAERDSIGFNVSGLQFIKRRIKNERELQTIDTVVSAEVQSYRQRKREEKAEEHKKEVKKKKNKVGRNKGMLDAMLEETAKEETKKVETTLEKNKKRKRDVEKEEQKKKLREMLGGDEQD